MTVSRRRLALSAAAALTLAHVSFTAPAQAQGRFPERPVHLVVPFPPGGTSDISGRILADALAKFPARTYADFAKLVGSAPGKYSYASSGNGGATNMAMEYYKSLSGHRIVHIPYRGTGPALTDVIGGQVEMLYDTVASSWAHIKAGRLVPVVVAAPERLKDLPEVPTMAEVGLPQANAGFWNGVLAPAGLPADVLATVHGAIKRAVQRPEVIQKYAEVGAIVVVDEPPAFAKLIAADVEKWKAVAASANISLD